MSQTTTPILNYGRTNHRRRLLRRILVVLLLTVSLFGAKRYGPPTWRKGMELYRQRWCMNYVGPADAEPPTRTPDRFLRLLNPWRDHGFWRDDDYGPNRRMLFLHGRRAKGGPERLVIVYGKLDSGRPDSTDRKWEPDELAYQLRWEAVVMVPASWSKSFGGTEELAGLASNLWNIAVAKRVRLFNGQPDPADPSRFTIVYEVDAQRGTIEGRLDNDDNIKMKILDGPAKQFNPDE
jgi:hypothetical protein